MRVKRTAGLALICALGASLFLSPTASSASSLADHALTPDAEAGECHTGTPTRITEPVPAFGMLQASLAQQITKGENVTVAIVDSGINGADPRLAPRIAGGVNLVPDGSDPRGLTDVEGHGTAIAGAIAAQPSSDSGVQGLAPNVQLYSVRVYASLQQNDIDAGRGPSTQRLADGIRAAADAHAQVINVSMSTPYSPAFLDEAVKYATSKGSLVVASSGNLLPQDQALGETEATAAGPRYPAGSEGALGVAATTVPGGQVTQDSRHGPHVAISAPGQYFLTLGLNTGDCVFASEAPASSYATAYVSAAAALVASHFPSETPDQWKYRLTAFALRPVADARDDNQGWGLVQPYESLTQIPNASTLGPNNPFVVEAAPTNTVAAPPLLIPASSDQPARDRERVLLLTVIVLSVLSLFALVRVFVSARSRSAEKRKAEAFAARSASAEPDGS